MSDASNAAPTNAGSAAGSSTEAEVAAKATPPKFTIPRKGKAVAGASPNAQVNEDRASRDRGEDGRPPMRSGLLVPAQLDQVMAQAVAEADAAAAVTQRLGAAAMLPQNLSGPPPHAVRPSAPSPNHVP